MAAEMTAKKSIMEAIYQGRLIECVLSNMSGAKVILIASNI